VKLYPSFRRAHRAGKINLDGELTLYLVGDGYTFSKDHTKPSEVPTVAKRSLTGAHWTGGTEDD
jgi:hypothetical protein